MGGSSHDCTSPPTALASQGAARYAVPMRRRSLMALAACLALGACTSDTAVPESGGADGATDAVGDVPASDVAADPAADTVPDAVADTRPDAPLDAPLDTPVDAQPDPAPPWCATYGEPEVVGNLATELTETSGLGASRVHDGVVWAHNDSGNGARLYAIDLTGALVADLALTGATNRDQEDLAVAPCGDRSCVYLGDIGDNGARYPDVVIYRVPEPALDATATDPVEAVRLTYPDGARDAEALLVGPDETVWILSKEPGLARVYSAPFPRGDAELMFRGELDLSTLPAGDRELLTGADFDAATGRVLLRTYTGIAEARLGPGVDVSALLSVPITRVPAGVELQGEAVAALPDGYLHVAEGRGPRVWRIRCE